MATKQERARNQWPAHIELPTNDWLFTQEQIDSSPSLRDDPERRKIGKLLHFMSSIMMPSEVHFLAQIYLRRYFQRCFFMGDKRDWYTATTCIFLAARTLEMHIGLDKLIKRAVERLQGPVNQSKLNKEFYDWKDGMLKSEMVVMEKLCCDFILFEPFSEYTLSYSVPNQENPYETATNGREVTDFWHWIHPHTDHGAFGFFAHKLKSWGGHNIFLLYTLEEVSIAILIYTAGKFSIVFPKDYFKVRGMLLSGEKFKALIDLFYKIQSTSHPEYNSVYAALRNCPEILDVNYNPERPESEHNKISGAVTASENNGLQSIHEISTQDQDFTSTANVTPQTPDPERVKTDYGQGVHTERSVNSQTAVDQQRDGDTPSTQPPNTTASVPNNLTPYQQTIEAPKSNHFSGPSASTTPGHISMLKAAAPLIPMVSKKVIMKKATSNSPPFKEPFVKKEKEKEKEKDSTDGQVPSSCSTTTTSSSSTTTMNTTNVTKLKRSKKIIDSPHASEDPESPKKVPRLSAKSTPQSSAKLASTTEKVPTRTRQRAPVSNSSSPAIVATPKSIENSQKVTGKRRSVVQPTPSKKKTHSMSSPAAKSKTVTKKRRSVSDPAPLPLTEKQLRRAEELFALFEDGELSDVESVIKPPGLS